MAKINSKNDRRQRIHRRVRQHMTGSSARPRLCVFRSLKHTYAQLVDDGQGATLAFASTLKLEGKRLKNGGNLEAAKRIGKEIADLAKAKGIESVVFDRGGYRYHGRVKALAEAAREAGLKF